MALQMKNALAGAGGSSAFNRIQSAVTGPYIGEIIPAWAEVDMTRGDEGAVDVVAQVDLFSAAPYEVSRPKKPLTVPTY